jgi:uncharacterized membrane protein
MLEVEVEDNITILLQLTQEQVAAVTEKVETEELVIVVQTILAVVVAAVLVLAVVVLKMEELEDQE